MLVSCLGDILLDVIVDAPAGFVPDDDTPARITFAAGGQAANVAAWVVALGGQARVFGPRAETGNGRLVDDALRAAGVGLHGPLTDRAGTVVSLIAAGYRSMASDPGPGDWLDEIAPGPWLDGADWLFVSGFALMRAASPELIVEVAAAARAAGTRVAVDLASAARITAYGAPAFRRLWRSLRPSVVLANDQEWAATNALGSGSAAAWPDAAEPFGAGGTSVLALKHGPDGCTFVIDGVPDERKPQPGPVRDVTGAGDSLTAGFLVGGADLAMRTAAQCVAHVGAQPRSGLDETWGEPA